MATGDRPPFWPTLRSAVRGRDLVALAAVPLVLVAVFALPAPVKQSLSFSYVDPTPMTAVTSAFVHLSVGHLVANLLGYLLVGSVGYLLAVLGGRRRLFAVAAITYVLAFPPVLAALNLAVPRPAVGFGFSGVDMAFAGLLPILLVGYAKRRFLPWLADRHAPALFFAEMALVSLVAVPHSGLSLVVVGASVLGALAYARSALESARTDGRRYEGPLAGWVEVLVLGLVTAVAYPVVGFPADPTGAGSVVNLYGHFLGYGLAFIGPYLAIEAGVFDE